MMCKMMKKGILGAALGAGALTLLFGSTKAWNYTHYAYTAVRESAQSAVPFEAEIDAARQQVQALDPAIDRSIEALAKLEENVKDLHGDIVAFKGNLGKEVREMLVLRDSVGSGDVRRTSGVDASADEIKSDLARRLDSCSRAKSILQAKEETLKSREAAVTAIRKQLDEMRVQRKTLLSQIEAIEAKHKALQASRSVEDYRVDTSALSEVKKTVAELNHRLNIEARTAELRGQFADKRVTVGVEPGRDVLKEIDQEFGSTAKGSSDKSL